MAGRTLVVGGGIAGAVMLHALSERGEQRGAERSELVLLEGAERLGAHSSGRSAAIHRPAIHDPVTRALALETLDWLETRARSELGRAALDPVGLMITEGAAEDAPAAAWAEELLARGIAERVDVVRRASLAPHVRPIGARTWWLPRCGRVAAHALVRGLVEAAERRGAWVETGARVRRVLAEDGAVRGVELADGTVLAAERVVLAAGAWSAALGAGVDCQVPLAASRRHLFVTQALANVDPRLPVVWDDAAGFYARPYDGGLLLCGCDQDPVDPGVLAPRYTVVPEERERTLALAARIVPAERPYELDRGWCGLRDVGPGDRPILGPDPRLAGLVWCAGLGGHGFSIGIAAARVATDLMAGRDPGVAAPVGPVRTTAAAVTG